MSDFYILSSDAFNSLKIQKGHTLNQDEASFLIKGKDILKKYFQIKIDGIRAQLGNGQFQGNETPAYWTIQAIQGFADELDSMEQQIRQYQELEKNHKK